MKRVYNNERGSSLVMTIIAMAFISVLAAAVIGMTVTNIRLKQAQKESQKNFYNADSIVDAIRAGLYDLAAEASEEAYLEAFKVYGKAGTAMTEKYEEVFFTNMVKKLYAGNTAYDPSNTNYYFADEEIRKLITKADSGLEDDGVTANLLNGYQSHSGGLGTLLFDVDSLILKDISVMKTESKGDYQTKIKTDIRVNIPNMTSETNSEYLAYVLIADNQIRAEISGAVQTINGNIYSGIAKNNVTNAMDPEAGIIVGNGNKLVVNAKTAVTRGDLLLNGSGIVEMNGYKGNTLNLWAENIETKEHDNDLTINGNCRIADDLEMWGTNDKVSLSGTYHGYNFNDNYSQVDGSGKPVVSTKSEYSSAVMINGKNSNLNLSGLSFMNLAGFTFISKKLNSYDVGTPSEYKESVPVDNQDIAMGESITMKGSQVAYYVPSDYVKAGDQSSAGWTVFSIGSDQYSFDSSGYNKYLGHPNASFDVMTYLDTTTPLVRYYREDQKIKTGITYFYLHFKDEEQASAFYQEFTKCKPQADVAAINAKLLDANGLKIGSAMIDTNGNILYGDNSNAPGHGTHLELGSMEIDAADTYKLHQNAKSTSQEYMSLQMSLDSEYDVASIAVSKDQYHLSYQHPSSLSATDRTSIYTKCGDVFEDDGSDTVLTNRTNLFSVLIDETKLVNQSITDANGNAIITNSDKTQTVKWPADGHGEDGGLIIAKGDVELRGDFKGLVLAGGDIIFKQHGVTVSENYKRLKQMFETDKEEASPKFYNLFSKYFRKTINSTITKGEDEQKDTVEYENWKKNKE